MVSWKQLVYTNLMYTYLLPITKYTFHRGDHSQGTRCRQNFTNFSSTKKMKSIIGTFFKILLPFKNKILFILDNLLKYGHITLKFVGRYFHWVVAIYFPKNRTILVQNWRKKKIVKISFRLFKDWYNPMTIKPEGRGGG